MNLFEAGEFKKVKKTRLWMILLYALVAAVVVAADVLIVFFLRPINNGGALAANMILTILFGCGSLFYFCLPFRLVSKYYKMSKGIANGIKEHGKGKMLRFEEDLTEKDGVEFYGLVLEEEVKKRQDLPEHRILIEHTCLRPDINPGDRVSYVTQANILIEYEILERAPVVPANETVTDGESGSDGAEQETSRFRSEE